MKRSLLLVFALVLLASPAAYACEGCYKKGSYDPAGNYLTSDRCWSGQTNGYASCYVSLSGSCVTSTDSTCTGSSSGRIQHKDPVPYPMTDANPFDCATDLSGKCSGTTMQDTSFLE